MAYKRYRRGSAVPERVETSAQESSPPESTPPPERPPAARPSPTPGGLDAILSRFDPGRMEREDWAVLGVLWLLYRASGDTQLLIAMGAYLFL